MDILLIQRSVGRPLGRFCSLAAVNSRVCAFTRVLMYRVFSHLSGTRRGVDSRGQVVTPQPTPGCSPNLRNKHPAAPAPLWPKQVPPWGYTGCKWSLTSQNGVPSLYPFILLEVNVQDPSQVPPGAWSLRALPVPASPNIGDSDGSARHAPVPPLTWARGPAGDDRPAR